MRLIREKLFSRMLPLRPVGELSLIHIYIVLFLYRDDYYSNSEGGAPGEDADQNSCECIVAKNRHGESKAVPMHWQGEFMRFTSREVIRHE